MSEDAKNEARERVLDETAVVKDMAGRVLCNGADGLTP
jgi:hypothetical protein